MRVTSETIDDALLRIGNNRVSLLVESQRSKGLRASGWSAQSTRAQVSRNGVGPLLQIVGPHYWRYQERGRGPGRGGKRPPMALVEAIKKWVADKGLRLPYYAVAMKIHRDGIRVPNPFNPGKVVSEPLDPEAVREEIVSELRGHYAYTLLEIITPF